MRSSETMVFSMADELGDSQKGVWRWAWQRVFRHHFQGVAAFVIFPFAIGAIATPVTSSHWAHLNPYEILGLSVTGGFVLTVVVFGVFALAAAPYQQRKALRDCLAGKDREIGQRDDEIASLKSTISLEPVLPEHFKELKQILRDVREFVAYQSPITYRSKRDKESIVGHFEDLEVELDEWNTNVTSRKGIEEKLKVRFDAEVASLGLGVPSFAKPGLDKLFEMTKWNLTHGGKSDYRIQWYPRDPQRPNILALQDGTAIAECSDQLEALVYENCQIRIQQFVRLMENWPEMQVYANPISISNFLFSQTKLLENLDLRIGQSAYYRGNGCARCPQLTISSFRTQPSLRTPSPGE